MDQIFRENVSKSMKEIPTAAASKYSMSPFDLSVVYL